MLPRRVVNGYREFCLERMVGTDGIGTTLPPVRRPRQGRRRGTANSPSVGRLLATPARRAVGAVVALALLGVSLTTVLGSASAEDVDMPRALPVAIADQPVTTTTAAAPVPAEDPEETEAGASAAAAAALAASGKPRKPLVQLGEIRIPKIGLVHAIYEGVTLDVVDHGPGHWPGSAVPGQLGNAVFAGHRVTHSHPFRNLDQLVPGNEVFFTTKHGDFSYRVTGQEIVSSKDTWIAKPTPEATLTLFACHPPGSAKQRIVVRGILTSSLAG
jgi:sortase A